MLECSSPEQLVQGLTTREQVNACVPRHTHTAAAMNVRASMNVSFEFHHLENSRTSRTGDQWALQAYLGCKPGGDQDGGCRRADALRIRMASHNPTMNSQKKCMLARVYQDVPQSRVVNHNPSNVAGRQGSGCNAGSQLAAFEL